MTTDARDRDAYTETREHPTIGLQIGFTPNMHLATALGGFLLSEQTGGKTPEREARERSVGSSVVLRSMTEARFHISSSDNQGVVFDEPDGKLKAAEEARLARLASAKIALRDIALGINGLHDVELHLLLQPTEDQRSVLSGAVLGDSLEKSNGSLTVYKHFHHTKIEMDDLAVIRHARRIKSLIQGVRELNSRHPLAYVEPILYVTRPFLMPSELPPPKEEPAES